MPKDGVVVLHKTASPLDYKLQVSWTTSGRLKEETLCVDVIVNGVFHFCILFLRVQLYPK